MNSDPNLKIIASVINCSLVTLISLPIYFVAEIAVWKASAVALFFIYNVLFRKRCVGMYLVRTYQERPASVRFAALYSISYSSLLFYVYVPGDLLCINGLVFQLPCLALVGNTAHGYLAGQQTLSCSA